MPFCPATPPYKPEPCMMPLPDYITPAAAPSLELEIPILLVLAGIYILAYLWWETKER